MKRYESRPAEILLIEDSPSDAALTIGALKAGKIANTLTHVHDGVEAMECLRRQGSFAGAPVPDLIMLDLNLPRKDGREVLAELKADARLKMIPVIVLTTSSSDADILASYNLNANCYIVKPVDYARFLEVIRSIEYFWLSIVALPQGQE